MKRVINTYDGFRGGMIQITMKDDHNIELFTHEENDYNSFIDIIPKTLFY